MERKFISLDGLRYILRPKELKNVFGGSGDYFWCNSDHKECSSDKDCTGNSDCYPCKDGISRCIGKS